MSSDLRAENLGILLDAIDAPGAGGIVRAEGFRWEPGQTQRLARRVGATSRVVELAEPTLPQGGIWLVIARALGTSGTGDPRRQARRGIAEAMGMRRTTLLVVEQAAQLPAATLASLVATTHEEPGLRLLLFVEAGEHLAGPLPDSVQTTLAFTPATTPPRPLPAPKLAPRPAASAAATAARPTPPSPSESTSRPTVASFRVIGPAAFAIGIVAGWFWLQGSESDITMASETPTTSAAPLPEVAAAPRSAPPDPPSSATALPKPTPAKPPAPERAIEPATRAAPIPAAVAAVAEAAPVPDVAATPEPSLPPVAAAAKTESPAPATDANLSAPININAYPWARIEIAGRTIGETPIGELRLPRGSHDVRAVFADGSSRVRRVKADGNERFIMFGTPAR